MMSELAEIEEIKIKYVSQMLTDFEDQSLFEAKYVQFLSREKKKFLLPFFNDQRFVRDVLVLFVEKIHERETEELIRLKKNMKDIFKLPVEVEPFKTSKDDVLKILDREQKQEFPQKRTNRGNVCVVFSLGFLFLFGIFYPSRK